MILVPTQYSPRTMITRLEQSHAFGFTWRNWILRGGERYQTPYIIGPHRHTARPTLPSEEEGEISYAGKYLRTNIELVAVSPQDEKCALEDKLAWHELIILLGMPAVVGKKGRVSRVLRYDFLVDSCIPQVYDLELLAQEHIQHLLEDEETNIVRGRLPKEVKQRLLRQ